MPAINMDKIVAFNSQTTGRDKLFRLMQYGSRIVWAYLENRSYDKDAINRLKNLEYSLSTARKLYRLGRSVDLFYGALKSINLSDPVHRYTITLSKINTALFFLADHILWLERVGLATINKPKWSRLSYKLWLYYLTMNLMRDAYEIVHILSRHSTKYYSASVLHSPINKPELSKFEELYHLFSQHKDVVVDTVKNGCDVWIPLTQLGVVSLSPGIVGLLGVISSIAGILPLFDRACKLSPS